MTGRRITLHAGVVAAVTAALLALPATPAHAQANLHVGGVNNISLQVGGGAQSVNLQVENRGDEPSAAAQLTLTIPGDLSSIGVHIVSQPPGCTPGGNGSRLDCTIDPLDPGGSWSGVVQIGVHGNSNVQAGERRSGQVQVVVSGVHPPTTFGVTVHGPERAPTVEEVSGYVTNERTGERISGATVYLVDGERATYQATTDANGEFRFVGERIAPGTIGLRASMDGYEGDAVTQQVGAGQRLTGIQLTLRSTASPTPSATRSASPTPSATASPSPAAAAVEPPDTGMTFFTRLMIVLGVLFLLIGIGAIAFLIWRRRREQAEEDEGPDDTALPTSGPPDPAPRPGSRGIYRPAPDNPTQVISPAGGGPRTAVMPSGGGLADAPTMLHPRAGAGATDETTVLPSPTGAGAGAADETTVLPRAQDPPGPRPPVPGTPPPPRTGGPTYGEPTRAMDDPRARGAGGPSGPGYGSPVTRPEADGGYGGADQPTGRHGYGAAPYEGGGGAYGPDPYTVSSGGHRLGHDAGPDYESPTSAAPRSGYGAGQSGYDRFNYDQPTQTPPGYDQPTQTPPGARPGYAPGGYGAEPDSYGAESGGYGAEPGGYGAPGYRRAEEYGGPGGYLPSGETGQAVPHPRTGDQSDGYPPAGDYPRAGGYPPSDGYPPAGGHPGMGAGYPARDAHSPAGSGGYPSTGAGYPPSGGGGYPPASGGYSPATGGGYPAGGHDSGYGGQAPYGQSGYPGSGYGQQAGYADERYPGADPHSDQGRSVPRPRAGEPERRLDWLDN